LSGLTTSYVAAGLAYDVKDTTVTGNTAVITITLAGAAASLASESESLTYSAGRWGFIPNDSATTNTAA
jgi:hypothetical protein